MTRTSLRADRAKKRGRLRNTLLLVACILVMGGVAAGVIVLLTMSSGGLKVPKLVGMKYDDAKKQVESRGLFIQIDPMQDSSGEVGKLKIKLQDPKPGASAEANDTVTVQLTGLHESSKYSGESNDKLDVAPSSSAAPAPAQESQPGAAVQPAQASRVVCIDPGHSGRSGSEIDPATGLNVGDNGGASGELSNMWDLAQKTKAALEGAGYTVRLTKDSADAYSSLRARADVGNQCAAVVRLHYDDTGYTGVMRPPAGGARCPQSDPGRATVVDAGVTSASDSLARALAGPLGLQVRDDTGGTSLGNGTPAGHPTCLVGSALSRVPVVCIENKMSLVRDNPGGQDQVASQIVAGLNAYFQSH